MATFTKRPSQYDRSKVPDGKDYRIGLVVSKWNETITELLYKGAKDTLLDHNVAEKNIIRIDVPGSFELIYGASRAQQMSLDVIITIGCVIKGDTRHFEFISNAIAQGIKDLNLNGKAPVVFCVCLLYTSPSPRD